MIKLRVDKDEEWVPTTTKPTNPQLTICMKTASTPHDRVVERRDGFWRNM